MITAETLYEKAKDLDTATLQEVADFLDFVTRKHDRQRQYEEMRKYFPAGEINKTLQKPAYTTKTLTIEQMDEAIEYEAGLRK